MIHPSEVAPVGTKAAGHDRDVGLLERLCDTAIRQADATGHWPARVGRPRTTIGELAIQEIHAKYRAAGWVVERPGGTGSLLRISRPGENYQDGTAYYEG